MKANSRRQGHWPLALLVSDFSESKRPHFCFQMPAIPLLKCKWRPQSVSKVRFQKPSFIRMVRSHCLSETEIPDDWRPRRLIAYLKRSKQPFNWARR